ncbi:hypothetical protein D3C78_588570 [compost metagenome]
MATAQCAWRAVAAISSGRGFGVDTRVIAGGNRPLNALDIAQLRLARRNVLSLYRGGLVSQELFGHGQAAVAAECQLGAIMQAHSHGTCGTRLQLLARVQAIALDQRASAAIAANGKYLPHHLADHTD